jgi:hypothetical protein
MDFIDHAWLIRAGFPEEIDEADLVRLIAEQQEVLLQRVCVALMDELDADGLEQFIQLVEDGAERAAVALLRRQCPEFSNIVRNELFGLEDELRTRLRVAEAAGP